LRKEIGAAAQKSSKFPVGHCAASSRALRRDKRGVTLWSTGPVCGDRGPAASSLIPVAFGDLNRLATFGELPINIEQKAFQVYGPNLRARFMRLLAGGFVKKKTVTKFLIGFHVFTLDAVFFRVDTFPLTWVPMYSQFHGQTQLVVLVGDKAKLRKGFEITTAAGETEFIGPKTLNVPNAAFRRLYTERAFGKGPPKHLRERERLNPLSDAVFNLFYEDPRTGIDWHSRLLDMMNKTLDREPGDPDYIVQAIATYEFTNVSRETRRTGDLSDLSLEMRTAVITKRTP